MPHIISSQSFAGLSKFGFVPPVDDATVCAWIGAEDNDIAIRNWGTGSDLIPVGTQNSVDELFRRFSHSSYLDLGVPLTEKMTIVALVRNPSPLSGYGLIASTERLTSAIQRDGFSFLRANASPFQFRGVAHGTTGAAQAFQNTAAVGPSDNTDPHILMFQIEDLGTGNGLRMRVGKLSGTPSISSWANNTNDTLGYGDSPENWNIRVGSHYASGASVGSIDVGFIMVVPRLLSDAELTASTVPIIARAEALGFEL